MSETREEFIPAYRGSFYGIPCYVGKDLETMWGTNMICDYLIMFAVHMHNFAVSIGIIDGEDGFPVKIYDECDDPPANE